MSSKYWDDIYKVKTENEMSWYQDKPEISLAEISALKLDPHDKIIDIGGGDSKLVDHLLNLGFKDITVLDISIHALEKLKIRLGDRMAHVKLIATDIINFKPSEQYKLWHDRAAFHFLTKPDDIKKYLQIADQSISDNGFLILSTFSKTGPEKCSGLPIRQYSSSDLISLFDRHFTKINCFESPHHTPWNSAQNFTYCIFKKN